MSDELITKVKPRPIQRDDALEPINIPDRYLPKILQAIDPSQFYIGELSFWEKAKLYSKITYIAIRLIPYFITIKAGIMFNDWKTTTTGVVKAIFSVLAIFGISTGQVTEGLVLAIGYALADLLQAIFTSDAKKNGQ